MTDVLVLGARGLAGGALVALFAVIGEIVKPKSFAGVFSGAPSVALAGLLITVAVTGVGDARTESYAMAFAAAGFVAYCLVAVVLVDRLGARLGSLVAYLSWFLVAGTLYAAVLA